MEVPVLVVGDRPAAVEDVRVVRVRPVAPAGGVRVGHVDPVVVDDAVRVLGQEAAVAPALALDPRAGAGPGAEHAASLLGDVGARLVDVALEGRLDFDAVQVDQKAVALPVKLEVAFAQFFVVG